MEKTKNNYSSKRAKKNVFLQMIDLWKIDVNWHKHTKKDKKVCIGFGLSFSALIMFGCSWLAIPAIIGLVYCLSHMKDLNVEE